jgi:hypothetical protein
MTLLGKILTVGILIASLLLMFFGMTVYGTHKNWKADYDALNTRLTQAQAETAALTSRYEGQISQLQAEQEATLQEMRKLETARTEVLAQNADLQTEVGELRAERAAAVATVAATEENNTRLMDDVVALRETTRDSQRARDEAFTKTLQAMSDLHVTAGDLEAANERNAQLVAQLADVTRAAIEGGVDLEGEVITQARGEITATRRADGGQLIEITIGFDDGIRPGHTVEVYRGDRYLGRALILRADPDRAVGRIIPEYQQGQIQEGDRVATNFRFR